MTTRIRNVLGFAVRDPRFCTQLIWDTATALNWLQATEPVLFPAASPFTEVERAELLDFLHGRAQTWGSQNPAPLVLDLDGKTYTGAEVLYIISHTVGGELSAASARVVGTGTPPVPPPPY